MNHNLAPGFDSHNDVKAYVFFYPESIIDIHWGYTVDVFATVMHHSHEEYREYGPEGENVVLLFLMVDMSQ